MNTSTHIITFISEELARKWRDTHGTYSGQINNTTIIFWPDLGNNTVKIFLAIEQFIKDNAIEIGDINWLRVEESYDVATIVRTVNRAKKVEA